jgi:hypothetical protein
VFPGTDVTDGKTSSREASLDTANTNLERMNKKNTTFPRKFTTFSLLVYVSEQDAWNLITRIEPSDVTSCEKVYKVLRHEMKLISAVSTYYLICFH